MNAPKSRTPVIAGALAAVAATAALIAPWEGRELEPYRDIVGIWTVCYGHTGDVQPRPYSPRECEALLRKDAAQHLIGVAECVNRPLDRNEWVAVGSWAFNVGVNAACRSTLVRKINAGAPAQEWCRELLKWNKAGGREVRGLTKRREAEYRECVK